jgi:hypothetical protein
MDSGKVDLTELQGCREGETGVIGIRGAVIRYL